MKSLRVKTQSEYEVTITDSLAAFTEKVSLLIKGDLVAVITDSNVDGIYKNEIENSLTGKKVIKFVVPAGEESKNAENYLKILNGLADNGFTREDTVITFGGGVVGDLGAFVASTYMRGIKLIAVPTTLLSMVDSSVGGKTAINLEKGKNLCGTFYQPSAVYINTGFLKTLPKKEVLCGLGEILKYRFISKDAEIDISKIDEDLIYKCLKIKADIVSKDEKESGKRKLLNFGHTFGHAIEKLSHFTIPHGICVAKGIVYALKISEKYFGTSEKVRKDYILTAENLGIDVSCEYDLNELISLISIDKKRSGKGADFVLIDDKFRPEIVNILLSEIKGYIL